MAKDDPHFRLRLPAELKAEVERAAKENNRSINAEIVSRLEDSILARNGIVDALMVAERSLQREREALDVMKWFVTQQKAANAMLEMVAESDGKISPDLLKLIRHAMDNRGKDSDFPMPPED